MKVLDVGCGRAKRPGAVGIDFNAATDADIVHDLNVVPYPFPDGEFDAIYVSHCIEHLDDVVRTMEELHRVAKPGAHVVIDAPYFSGLDAFSDPTHKHFFTSRSFDYFTGDFPEYSFYSARARFRKIAVRIDFWKIHRLGGVRLQNYIGPGLLANRFTPLYEKYLAFNIPAQSIRYTLEVVK